MKLDRTLALSIPVGLALALTGCPPAETDTNPDTTTTTTEPDADPAALEAPPAGEGVQLETPEISVEPGAEVQNCYFFKVSDLAKAGGLDDKSPINLHRVQVAQRDGSHHMNVFRVKSVVGLDPTKGTVTGLNGAGECFKSPNWADWPLVANSQQDGQLDWTFPEGVANTFDPDEWLMLQSHYVNAATQKTEDVGQVRINFWTIPKAEVTAEMGTVFATKQSIRVCQSNPAPSYSGSCSFNSPDPVHIIGANGHFHSRGTKFDMFSWDGVTTEEPPAKDLFYTSEAWDDPPMKISPELDLMVPKQAGVFYTCTYEWRQPDVSVGCKGLDEFDKTKYSTPEENLDCCYTFGPIVEKNEHCNIFVYYYPKQDDVNCF
jgi:hypothetical protein